MAVSRDHRASGKTEGDRFAEELGDVAALMRAALAQGEPKLLHTLRYPEFHADDPSRRRYEEEIGRGADGDIRTWIVSGLQLGCPRDGLMLWWLTGVNRQLISFAPHLYGPIGCHQSFGVEARPSNRMIVEPGHLRIFGWEIMGVDFLRKYR